MQRPLRASVPIIFSLWCKLKKKKKKDLAHGPLFPSNNAVFQSNMCSFSPHATEHTDIETEPLTFVLCHMLCFLHDSPSFSAILRLNVYMFSKCQRSVLCWWTDNRPISLQLPWMDRKAANRLALGKMWNIVNRCIHQSWGHKAAAVDFAGH